MSHYLPHHLKRLQHDINSNLHLSSHNHQSHNSRTNSFDYRSPLPNEEAMRESIQHFTISNNNNNINNTKLSQPVDIFHFLLLIKSFLFSLNQVLDMHDVVVVVDDHVIVVGIHH
jgi:hypothetical protein